MVVGGSRLAIIVIALVGGGGPLCEGLQHGDTRFHHIIGERGRLGHKHEAEVQGRVKKKSGGPGLWQGWACSKSNDPQLT